MYYDTIKKEIGRRLGDPLLDKYRALVGPVFAESVGSMILAEDYSANDIQNNPFSIPYPLLITQTYDLGEGLQGVESFILPSDLFVVQDVLLLADFSNYPASIPLYNPILKEIDKNTQRRMAREDALKPAAFEIFYLIGDYYIKFYKSNEWILENDSRIPIDMYYLKSPSNDVWQNLNSIIVDGLNLETDVGLSPQFIQKAINRATQSLIGGEKGES
jgi:hypothetical protein